MLVLGQLRKQQQVSSKTTQQTIPRYTWISTHSPFHLLPWLRNIFLERNNYLILGTHLSRKWPIMTQCALHGYLYAWTSAENNRPEENDKQRMLTIHHYEIQILVHVLVLDRDSGASNSIAVHLSKQLSIYTEFQITDVCRGKEDLVTIDRFLWMLLECWQRE